MILEFFQIKVSESELRKKLKTKPFGTHIINVLTINETYGIQAKIQFWSLEELKNYLKHEKIPCITLVWTEHLANWSNACMHAVVVCGYDDDHVIVNDPYFENQDFYIPFHDFINAWQVNDGLVTIFKKIS
ncbi:cysteine peptidase family C39 domain-containing protein [candidate division KSB1 bacterium]|nr:cysteine peptidase family C39 domain-containing protein [candidate division KSB1 bacterium]